MGWQRYWRWLRRSLLASMLALAGAIWIVDPYGNLPFSPPLERTAMATNQRYAYPAIARDPRFDSAVLGTSTSRLLRPASLDAALGGRFANLAMNSATAYEQSRLLEVFLRARPAPRTVIVGLDSFWCTVEDELTKYSRRRFPEWMYDDSAWNDIPQMLEFKTLETLARQAGYLLGFREARYQPDGYANFLPPIADYDLARAREKIYDTAIPRELRGADLSTDESKAAWSYPSHEVLEGMLSRLPETTRKILLFVPYHSHRHGAPDSLIAANWRECKDRIVRIAGGHANIVVLDFMIASPITVEDRNYWDDVHFTTEIAEQVVRMIAAGANGHPAEDGAYLILAGS